MARKSISWMNSFVLPPLSRFTCSTSFFIPGKKLSLPILSNGPEGTSRIPVASMTIAAGLPCANLPYQSRTSGMTSPSLDARHGTIAGIQLRACKFKRPTFNGENNKDLATSSGVGISPNPDGQRIFCGGFHIQLFLPQFS